MTIAVTGASGRLGRLVSEMLLERLEPSGIVLITRHPEQLVHLSQRGADVRRGDFDDAGSVTAAFAGVQRILMISTGARDIGRRLRQHRAALDSAIANGVRHVAYTSLVDPCEGNPLGTLAREHRETEGMLRDSGLEWTFLRNSFYAEPKVRAVAEAIVAGELVTNAGDGRVAYVSREDCAAAATAVLTGEGHERMVYDITGPELVGEDDLAELATEFGGRPVAVAPIDDDGLVASLIATQTPEWLARGIASLGVATREGWLSRSSPTVEHLTGQAPRSLRDVLVAHQAELTPA